MHKKFLAIAFIQYDQAAYNEIMEAALEGLEAKAEEFVDFAKCPTIKVRFDDNTGRYKVVKEDLFNMLAVQMAGHQNIRINTIKPLRSGIPKAPKIKFGYADPFAIQPAAPPPIRARGWVAALQRAERIMGEEQEG